MSDWSFACQRRRRYRRRDLVGTRRSGRLRRGLRVGRRGARRDAGRHSRRREWRRRGRRRTGRRGARGRRRRRRRRNSYARRRRRRPRWRYGARRRARRCLGRCRGRCQNLAQHRDQVGTSHRTVAIEVAGRVEKRVPLARRRAQGERNALWRGVAEDGRHNGGEPRRRLRRLAGRRNGGDANEQRGQAANQRTGSRSKSTAVAFRHACSERCRKAHHEHETRE